MIMNIKLEALVSIADNEFFHIVVTDEYISYVPMSFDYGSTTLTELENSRHIDIIDKDMTINMDATMEMIFNDLVDRHEYSDLWRIYRIVWTWEEL